MSGEEGAGAGGLGGGSVSNQLAMLVPTFDPAVDNVDIWSSKVNLLLEAWPETKIVELATRLILNTKGSAYQKLRLHQKDLLVNDRKGIQKLVELVGGTWGQVPLEHRYELVEKALYRCQQKQDESGDSFIARVDVIWAELLTKSMSLEQIQAYVLLRGSRLSAEDKKRVLVESGAEVAGNKLEWKKVVAAIRMLGSSFFQDYTGVKREKSLKTYDHMAFNVEDQDEPDEAEAHWTYDEMLDDDTIASMAQEEDEDAALVMQFEEAVTEAVQADPDLATFFSSYQDARRRLTEKVRFRGFWPIRKGQKGSGKKGGKFMGKGKMSLAQKIANSHCRICGEKGHWKAECSKRPGANSGSTANSSQSVPISLAVAEEIPPEIQHLPMMPSTETLHEHEVCSFGVVTGITGINRHKGNTGHSQLHHKIQHVLRNKMMSLSSTEPKLRCLTGSSVPERVQSVVPGSHRVTCEDVSQELEVHFASTGTNGVVDLGASQTVIGSKQVTELLQGLPDHIRKQVRRSTCNLVFRFGNHQTLNSKHAIMLPLQGNWFRIAIVPGATPFLLSSRFLKEIQAVIDTDKGTMWSKLLKRYLVMERSPKDLFLMDVTQLWQPPDECSCMTQAETSETMSKSAAAIDASVTEIPQNLMVGNSVETLQSCASQVEEPRTQKPDQLANVHGVKHLCTAALGSKSDHNLSRFSDDSSGAPSCHVHLSSPVQAAVQGEEGCRPGGGECHDTGRAGLRENYVRGSQEGGTVQQGIRGHPMDRVHSEPLREQSEARASNVLEVRGVAPQEDARREAGEGSEGLDGRGEAGASRCVGGVADSGMRASADGDALDDPRGNERFTLLQSAAVPAHGTDGIPHARDDGLHAEAAGQCEDRELRYLNEQQVASLRDQVSAECSLLNATSDTDFDFVGPTDQTTFHRKIQHMIKVFQHELDDVQMMWQSRSCTLPKLDVLEVMCSDHSELVNQVLSCGGKAKRFGLSEGDLQTKSGRRKLFSTLIQHRPEHLWYSPECGPWGKFSNLNMGKSLQGLQQVMQRREQSVWQISLAVVLYRHQVQRSKHFHMEQPDGSFMFKLPSCGEIVRNTLECKFDLCRIGALKDPETAMPIRKRLHVQSTSRTFHVNLHKKFCLQDHVHKPIAGSIRVGTQSMSMSSFTENYPRKFAKQVAKLLLQSREHPILANEDSVEPTTDEHPTKRRRLSQKLSPTEIAQKFADINWQTVMTLANKLAPRVGPRVVDSGEIMRQVQHMCPLHDVHHIVLCRGTDRYSGPHQKLSPGLAPLRRRICIRRRHEDIVIDDEWETWERLTFKGLRRKGTPARVSLLVFASAKHVVGQNRTSEVMPPESMDHVPETSADVSNRRSLENPIDDPETKRARTEPNSSAETEDEQNAMNKVDRQVIDLASQRHGPKFAALPPETQSWILKVHRNLGHPGAQKLTEFCRQLGCEKQILSAIGDLRCSTCIENQVPKLARPSSIHEHGDFGDVVAVDGVTWTNSSGQQYHVYHFLDQSTLFQTAVVTHSHGAAQAVRALHQGWIQWAGPPGLLVMDAGTELNSEEFLNFLQQHGIKHRTIATDAHWQNARVERHGAVLQSILTKMDTEEPLDTFEKVEIAVSMATHTKNQWSRHRGFPPELLVFGKSTKVPGTINADDQLPAHSLALDSRPEGLQFRENLAIRERARRAFVSTDNCQILRRALVQKSRPTRGQYVHGDHVMMWKRKGEADGNWIGPLRVIIQESTSVVWVTMGHKLFRVAPEHLRPLSAMEDWNMQVREKEGHQSQLPSTSEMLNSIIPPHGGIQYHNLINSPITLPIETQDNNGPVTDENNIPTNTPDTETQEIQSSNNSEQPDLEPVPVSSTPSEAPAPIPNPIEVPVPELDTDEELFVHDESIFQVSADQCWRFEVNVGAQDIANWKAESHPHEMAFLVSAAKRQRSEVKISQLTSEDREKFHAAKMKEVESWIATETIAKILRHQIPRENILRSRWILTWKELDETQQNNGPPQHPKFKPKARLVVLGYEDPELENIPRDSPTMNKLTRMLILQYAASQHFDIRSFDVQTAFLRGSEQNQRVLGMEPPPEMRERLKLSQQEIVQLLKGAYGRVDAPFLWFTELKKSLEELGFHSSPFDPCLFTLHDEVTHETIGMIGVHVDDGLCCGNSKFLSKLQLLERKYPFGSQKLHEFTFTGLHIKQHHDYSISIDQTQYIKDINAITLSRQRRLQVEDPVSEAERQSLRALIGSLQYAAVNTRPDLGSRLGWLQSRINQAKVSTLIEANKILHEAKQHADVAIKIQPISLTDLRFVAFSDASFASEKCHDSHQGMIIMAADRKIGENKRSPVSPIVWHSKKIQKVAVSTLSAEAMALAGAVDILSWVRLYWAWMCDHRCDWKHADETLLRLPPAFSALTPEDEHKAQMSGTVSQVLKEVAHKQPGIITTDCKSLYDLINRTAPPSCTEFRTQLQAKLIKEHLHNGIQIRWVPSGAQVADALTKVMDNTMLRTCLQQGHYSLHDEHEILKSRSDARTRIRWLQSQTPQG